MNNLQLTVDLEKIRHNTQELVEKSREQGIHVTAVTKALCGMPELGQAMLDGGAFSLGESRLENIQRMKDAGVKGPFMLLRIPHLSAVDDVVRLADISLNSELSVIQALSAAAKKQEIIHDILIMVDLGDLREGVWPEDLLPFVKEVLELEGIRIRGLGTNLTCFGGVVPTEENLGKLVELAEAVERELDISLDILSGGNSSSVPLLFEGRIPERINHLRIGEAILLGRETLEGHKIPGLYDDAFILGAELIELKEKPSVPIGKIGMDAFGKTPKFEDKGQILRGILNIGRQDVDIEGLTPKDSRVTILGASSDHLLLDLSSLVDYVRVGTKLEFHMAYGALLSAATSEYVEKVLL